MYFGPNSPEKTKHPFNREETVGKLLGILETDYKQWTPLINTGYCDILLIKNTVREIETEINPMGPNPFTKRESLLFQIVLAIDISETYEPTPDVLQKLEMFTSGHIITAQVKSALKFIEKY